VGQDHAVGTLKRSTGGIAALLTLLVLCVACSQSPGDSRPSVDRTTPPDDIGSGLKPALAGLVVTEPSALTTVEYARFGTINTTWAEVEPVRGSYDFSAIDATLSSHPDIRFRLRIQTGKGAPTWLKQATGGCIVLYPATENGDKSCPARYWRRPFLQSFGRLMEAVAGRYEEDWQIVDVANGACSTAYAEPFILGVDDSSLAALTEAGLTMEKQRACIEGSTEAMMSSFTRTRVSIAGHGSWEFVDGRSWTSERDLLNELLERYPGRLVVEDHGLGPDDDVCPSPGEEAQTADSWLCYLAGLPTSVTPHGWQLTLNGGSMHTAAWAAVDMGACYIEYAAFQELSSDDRRAVNDALVDNCPDRLE
jgi:hypothetical protein